jgi:hypothetical protein
MLISIYKNSDRTSLQFFMELPEAIKNALQDNSNSNLSTTPLLADEEELNASVVYGGEVNDSIQIFGISQVGRHPEITDRNFFQVGSSEVGTIHDGVSHRSLSQVGSTEISSSKITLVHPALFQIGSTEVGIGEVSSTQIGFTQISPTEVNPTQVNLDEEIFIRNRACNPRCAQVLFTEIPQPASKPFPKLFSSNLSHDNTFLLANIYSTAQTLRTTTTPINFH